MLFSVKREKNSIAHFVPLVLLLIIIVGFYIFTNNITSKNSDQSRQLLERALSRSITQCYALEGTYPPSLDYLVENYGLSYDSEYYFIDYQYIGSNLRPDVTIIERN